MSDWRKVEVELEAWAREEVHGDYRRYIERNTNSSEVALGDIQLVTLGDADDPCSTRKLNLSSLARRLADTLTLRLVEPATKSIRQGPMDICPHGLFYPECPTCRLAQQGQEPKAKTQQEKP